MPVISRVMVDIVQPDLTDRPWQKVVKYMTREKNFMIELPEHIHKTLTKKKVSASTQEEVESLGARFIRVDGGSEDESAGGYAVEQTKDYITLQKEVIHKHAIKSDVVICSANIPGKKAPLLVDVDTVKAMKSGSIIVDLSAEAGGNCELTQNGKEIKAYGVKIVGNSKLHTLLPRKASKLYASNVFNFLQFLLKYGSTKSDHEILTQTYIGK